MILIEDNTIFSGTLVSAALNPFVSTLKSVLSFLSTNNIINPSFVCILLLCFIYHWKKDRLSLYIGLKKISRWQCWATAVFQPHKAQQAPVPPSQWLSVSVILPTECVPFTLSQLPVMGKCTGIMHTMLCTVQELILHTTSLIPIEKTVIPHLQS